MDRLQFNHLLDVEFGHQRALHDTKGGDYAGDEDVCANFKRIAADMGLTARQVWGVYAGKHWDAISTFLRDGQIASEPVDSRIRDLIAYLTLLMALVEDEHLAVQRVLLDPERPGRSDAEAAALIEAATGEAPSAAAIAVVQDDAKFLGTQSLGAYADVPVTADEDAEMAPARTCVCNQYQSMGNCYHVCKHPDELARPRQVPIPE